LTAIAGAFLRLPKRSLPNSGAKAAARKILALYSFGDGKIVQVTKGKEDIMSIASTRLFRGAVLSAALLSAIAISTVSQAQDRPVPPNTQVSTLPGTAQTPIPTVRSPVAMPAARQPHSQPAHSSGWVDSALAPTGAAQGDLISNAGTGP